MCWRGVYRASFQTQSALGAPTRLSSEALLPTNCRCRKRRLGSTTSVLAAPASRTSTSSVEKRQANGVVFKSGWPLLRFCFSRSADCCGCEVGHRGKPRQLWFSTCVAALRRAERSEERRGGKKRRP